MGLGQIAPMGATRDAEAFRTADGRITAGWSTALASVVGMTLGPSCALVFCFGIFLPALRQEFGWGIGAISLGSTLISLCVVVVSPVAGYLSDRYGGRRLILWSMPLFGLGVASLSLLQSDIRVFYLCLVAAALGGAGVWPVTYNKLTAEWFDRRLGLSLGIANMGIGIGAALVPALAGLVIANYGWRAAYAALGLLVVAIPWPVSFLMVKERAQAPGAASLPGRHEGLTFREAGRTREFWLTVAGFFILGAASSSVVVHQVQILIDAGLSSGQAAAMQSVLGLALIVGRVGTGWLLDRFRLPWIMAVLCCATAGAMVLLALGAPMGLAGLCAAVVGFVVGAEFDVLAYLIPRYFGRRAFGAIYGVVYAVFQVASALAIALQGLGRGATGSYATGLGIVTAMLVAGAGVFLAMGPYRFTTRSA